MVKNQHTPPPGQPAPEGWHNGSPSPTPGMPTGPQQAPVGFPNGNMPAPNPQQSSQLQQPGQQNHTQLTTHHQLQPQPSGLQQSNLHFPGPQGQASLPQPGIQPPPNTIHHVPGSGMNQTNPLPERPSVIAHSSTELEFPEPPPGAQPANYTPQPSRLPPVPPANVDSSSLPFPQP